MMIKLKPWDEVVRLGKEHNIYDDDLGTEYVLGLNRDVLPWGDYVESESADEDSDYFVDDDWLVKEYMVEPITPGDILRYGDTITDDAYASVVTEFGQRQAIHIRLISYNGDLYYHKMVDGDVVECRKVGSADA